MSERGAAVTKILDTRYVANENDTWSPDEPNALSSFGRELNRANLLLNDELNGQADDYFIQESQFFRVPVETSKGLSFEMVNMNAVLRAADQILAALKEKAN